MNNPSRSRTNARIPAAHLKVRKGIVLFLRMRLDMSNIVRIHFEHNQLRLLENGVIVVRTRPVLF